MFLRLIRLPVLLLDFFASGLRSIVKKYSDHIAIPVEMLKPDMPPMPGSEADEAGEGETVVNIP